MKVSPLRYCLVLLVWIPAAAYAQRSQKPPITYMPVTGRLIDGDTKLGGCQVITFKGNDRTGSLLTDKTGRFRTSVELDTLCALEFHCESYVPKRILINTHAKGVPKEMLVDEPLNMDVIMLPESKYEGVSTDALDFPFAIVKWDRKAEAFVQDADYAHDMQRTNGALLLMAARAR